MSVITTGILIVEDDADLGFLLHEVVETAAEGRERLQRGMYDLVLLDHKLPDGDGLDLLPHYHELAPDVPIILMTAFSTRQIALEATRIGAHDFFSKPFDLQEVQIVVRRVLEHRGRQVELKARRSSQHSM